MLVGPQSFICIVDAGNVFIDPTTDLISVLKLRVLGELWFFAEAG